MEAYSNCGRVRVAVDLKSCLCNWMFLLRQLPVFGLTLVSLSLGLFLEYLVDSMSLS